MFIVLIIEIDGLANKTEQLAPAYANRFILSVM